MRRSQRMSWSGALAVCAISLAGATLGSVGSAAPLQQSTATSVQAKKQALEKKKKKAKSNKAKQAKALAAKRADARRVSTAHVGAPAAERVVNTGVPAIGRVLDTPALAAQRGRGDGPGLSMPTMLAQAPERVGQAPAPVGQAPEREMRAPEVAPIFEQPGVLTPKGKALLEPTLQYSYSSSNRVALVGYTIIPALLIGVVDVREVKRNTFTGILTGRYGLSNRVELEAKLPYVMRSDTSVGRELGRDQEQAVNTAFEADGRGIGDVEFSARYQFNDGGLDNPYFIGGLRFKTRTGTDPFEVTTSNTVQGLTDGVQTRLPTGSGFYGLQPSLTMLFPSDPAVFFGSVSYLHSFARRNVTRRTDEGSEELGNVAPRAVLGFNFGMGLALNEKSSFSIGYDHSSVGKTRINGKTADDSVRVQLGTLLLGYSHRLNPQRMLNVSLGAGLTRDTPDVTLTLRVPISF